MTTGQLFARDVAPRRPRIIRMHVVDAGNGCGGGDEGSMIAVFECWKCNHNTGWVSAPSITEAKRGLPCPKCNEVPA